MSNITGWGAVYEGGPNAIYLRYVTLPVVSQEQCVLAHGWVADHMICAGLPEGGKDSCQVYDCI